MRQDAKSKQKKFKNISFLDIFFLFVKNIYMEQKRQNKIYIFFIILLSSLLVGSIVLGVLGIYDGDFDNTSTNLQLGATATIQIDGVGSHVLSYNLDGAFIAGDVLKQKILIKNNTEKDMFLRAKLNIFTGNGDDPILNMQTTEEWTKQSDGYFIYNDKIASLNTVALMNGLEIGEKKQMKSEKSYIIVISVEAISVDFDRTQIWGY